MENLLSTKDQKKITSGKHVLDFIEKNYKDEYQQGYFSSLGKIKYKITEKSTTEEILSICEQRRKKVFAGIHARTGSNDSMQYREEMTLFEKGAIRATYAIESNLNRFLAQKI